MAKLKSFKALRPKKKWVGEVAALPYDVMTKEEACQLVQGHPYSFLNIDMPEIHISEQGEAPYIYAGAYLDKMIKEGTFVVESEALYIYELETVDVHQYGLVGLVATEDYKNGIIKKHENTRSDKEQERIWHIKHCKAHTGPIFLVEDSIDTLAQELMDYTMTHLPLFNETFEDHITHRIYKISEIDFTNHLIECFRSVSSLYIADGHHRAAAACKVADQLGETVSEAQNFLAVIFPKEQLKILAYHRVIKDESGYTKEKLFERLNCNFDITIVIDHLFIPCEAHTFGMRYQKRWYKLSYKQSQLEHLSQSKSLDVSILQDEILAPIFNIEHPKEDSRIDFVPGVLAQETLNHRTDTDMDIAFSLYPTSLNELINVANANGLMPPKSTWFEPKLRSGFLIHPFKIDE